MSVCSMMLSIQTKLNYKSFSVEQTEISVVFAGLVQVTSERTSEWMLHLEQ